MSQNDFYEKDGEYFREIHPFGGDPGWFQFHRTLITQVIPEMDGAHVKVLLLFVERTTYAKPGDRDAALSAKTIAKTMNVAKSTAELAIKYLLERGIIKIKRRGDRTHSTVYALNKEFSLEEKMHKVPGPAAAETPEDEGGPEAGRPIIGTPQEVGSPIIGSQVARLSGTLEDQEDQKNTEGASLRCAPAPSPSALSEEEIPGEPPTLSSLKEAGAERREEPEPSNVLAMRSGNDWWWPIWRSAVQVPAIKARLEELSLYPALELAAQDAPPSWLPDWALLKINDIGRDNGLDLANNSVFVAAYLQWMDGQRSQGRKISKSGVNTFFRRLARDAAGSMDKAIRWTAQGSTWRTFKLEYVEPSFNPGVKSPDPLREPQPHDDPRWIALRDAVLAGRPLSPAQQAVFDELDARWKAAESNPSGMSVKYIIFTQQVYIAPFALKLLENHANSPAPDDALGKVEEVQGTSVLISSDLGVEWGQDERYSRKGTSSQPQPQKRSQRVFRAFQGISQNGRISPNGATTGTGQNKGHSGKLRSAESQQVLQYSGVNLQ